MDNALTKERNKYMENKLTISADLIHIFDHVKSRDDAVLALVDLLEKKGFVKPSFGEAVLKREKIFPTGLNTQPVNIAIPHTDSEHVNQGAIAIGVLPAPVQFYEMGSENTLLDVSIICVLAIKEPRSLAGLLRSLALSFQKPDFLTAVMASKSNEQVMKTFLNQLGEVVEAGD